MGKHTSAGELVWEGGMRAALWESWGTLLISFLTLGQVPEKLHAGGGVAAIES